LYVASDSLLNKIVDFVNNGGHVIMSVKSGFCDENNTVRAVKAPGPIRKAAGIYYQEFSNCGSVPLMGDPFKVGAEKNNASDWIEFLIPETAKALATYNDPFFGKYPAITENKYGKGTFIYEGCLVTDEIQKKIVSGKAIELGLISSGNITYPVVIKSGINDQGKTIRYYLNYSDKETSMVYNYSKGTNLFSNTVISKGSRIMLKPWDVAIIEE